MAELRGARFVLASSAVSVPLALPDTLAAILSSGIVCKMYSTLAE
jgi:hypothetical protein